MERLPKWVICIPLIVQWFGLSIRYGSFTLPSAANPCITAGGLIGEGKAEYFVGGRLLQRALAPCLVMPGGAMTPPAHELDQSLKTVRLSFPLIAKPDVGFCGYGVRRVDTFDGLHTYLRNFPDGERVVIQEYVAARNEAGIFYVREPKAARGRITGIAFRHFPKVVGDGVHTVETLVGRNPRLARLRSAGHQADYDPTLIPGIGEEVRLATVGSTRIGGLYTDGTSFVTPELTLAIDAIAKDMPRFHFGRFDVRFDDMAELCKGGGFKIIEINGAGSEAIQAWDPGFSLFEGLKLVFEKQALLFRISAASRKLGAKPIVLRELARLFFHQQRLISRYPPSN